MIKIEEINKNHVGIHEVAKFLASQTALNNAYELKDITEDLKCSSHTLHKYLKSLSKKGIIKMVSHGHQRYYISNYLSIFADEEQDDKCKCGQTITYFKRGDIRMCEECFDSLINQS